MEIMMINQNAIPEFSLFGGPLHKFAERLGLVKNRTNSFRLGLVLACFTWGVLFFLALMQGAIDRIFSMDLIAAHVRILVAIPLFFLCETWVAPRMADFVRNIVAAGVVPEAEHEDLVKNIRRVNLLKDHWLAESLFLLAVFVIPLLEMIGLLPGKTGNAAWIIEQSGGNLTWVNAWYLGVCLPLFRFLMVRWLWHLALWCYFLHRVEKLNLNLVPTHTGGAAGLGYVEVVQEHFMPLVVAISAVLSASFAENIASGTMTFERLYGLALIVLLVNAVLFIGPLFVFSRKLWNCRATGMNSYMIMAHKYVDAFDKKWLKDKNVTGESQLGTGDIQSLADLTNSLMVVIGMRWVPVSRRLLIELVVCVMLPLTPLVLLKFPLDQIAVQLFQMLIGQ
jgi:hypothetical protein